MGAGHMMYQGGKARLAKPIAEQIQARRGGRRRYLEPFLGGASVFSLVAPTFEQALGADVQTDLVLMWQAAADGWRAPETLTRQEYDTLRHDQAPSPMRAFAAYPCSYAGKRFGGYAVSPSVPRNYAKAGSRSIERTAQAMRMPHILISEMDYRLHKVDADTVVYCDPPYAGTLGYRSTDTFDHAEFWETMTVWAGLGALVLVSEYSAPAGWVPVLEMDRHTSTALDNAGSRAVDKLYAADGWAS